MNRLTRSQRLALCALVALLLYLPGLGRPALLEPDEGRYAEVAREMVVRSDYVTPRDNWVRYFEKPPLIYWANAGAIKLLGVNEFAVRLPTALFSVGQVLVIAALGEAMFGAAVGILGALALALSPLFFGFARFATPDPALAFFMTAALAAFWTASRCGSFGHGRGRLWMIAAAAMLGFGTLAKGPVALVLAGAIALVYLIVEGRIREALAMPWLWCIVAYLAIALPWFILVAERNPGFLRFFFIHEHVKRYLEDTEHGWGPYFFVIVVAGGMWPWLYFIPLGIKELLRGDGGDERGAASRSALWFLLIWFGLIFIFFSIPRSKLGSYILPGIPPLAIIAGYGLWRLDRIGAARERRLIASFLVVNVILAVAVATTLVVIHDRLATALIADGIAVAAAFVIGAGLAYCSIRLGRGGHAIAPGVTVAAIAVGVALAMGAMIKAREDAAAMFSYRELARAVTPYLDGNGCVLASYLHYVQSLPFYTRHREALVDYRGELAPFSKSPDARASFIPSDAHLRALWQSPRCIVLIANRHDLHHLGQLLTPPGAVIGCEGKKVALISQPPAKPAATADACVAPIWNSSEETAPGLGFFKGHL